MGVAGEQHPLLPIAGTPVVVAKDEVAMKNPRQWGGAWWNPVGTGEPQDIAACCLSWHAPFVAFGWNSARGLRMSWWREALKFLLLTLGVFVTLRVACCVMVMVACGGAGPMPRAQPMPMPMVHPGSRGVDRMGNAMVTPTDAMPMDMDMKGMDPNKPCDHATTSSAGINTGAAASTDAFVGYAPQVETTSAQQPRDRKMRAAATAAVATATAEAQGAYDDDVYGEYEYFNNAYAGSAYTYGYDDAALYDDDYYGDAEYGYYGEYNEADMKDLYEYIDYAKEEDATNVATDAGPLRTQVIDNKFVELDGLSSDPESDGESDGESQSESEDDGESQSESESDGESQSDSEKDGESQSQSESESESESEDDAAGVPWVTQTKIFPAFGRSAVRTGLVLGQRPEPRMMDQAESDPWKPVTWVNDRPGSDSEHMFDDMALMVNDECVARILPGMLALSSVGIVAAIYMVVWAARRRTALRTQFGIDGSKTEDCLLWTACAPCALAQETRTLMHNCVEEGLWHGNPMDVPPSVIVASQSAKA